VPLLQVNNVEAVVAPKHDIATMVLHEHLLEFVFVEGRRLFKRNNLSLVELPIDIVSYDNICEQNKVFVVADKKGDRVRYTVYCLVLEQLRFLFDLRLWLLMLGRLLCFLLLNRLRWAWPLWGWAQRN